MNAMNRVNQILLIKKFINSKDKNLLINYVNEELSTFYFGIIKRYANQQDIKINIEDNLETINIEGDLFETKSIQILNITNTKKLDTLLNDNNKKIIFTDYKNYKKFNSKYDCINGYQSEKDIYFFINKELKIDNDELLYYCKNNPALIFSEISKYLINKKQYIADQVPFEEKNHILHIRKSIFQIKRNNFNIKNLYINLKKEAEYKKLSFLIY